MKKNKGKLNEREQDEFLSISHYIEYVNTNPDAKDFEIFSALKKLNELGQKFSHRNLDEKEYEILNLDTMKELCEKFFKQLQKEIEKQDSGD